MQFWCPALVCLFALSFCETCRLNDFLVWLDYLYVCTYKYVEFLSDGFCRTYIHSEKYRLGTCICIPTTVLHCIFCLINTPKDPNPTLNYFERGQLCQYASLQGLDLVCVLKFDHFPDKLVTDSESNPKSPTSCI